MALVTRFDPADINLPGLKVVTLEIDFDSSYVTGGEPLDLSDYFSVIKGAVFESKAGYQFELTDKDAPADCKVKAYRVPGLAFTGTALDPATKIKAKVIQGGAAGNHSVNSVASADTLIGVFQTNTISDDTSNTQQVADLIDLTSEFSIAATSTISNAGGTATASTEELLVLFAKSYTPAGSNAAAAMAEVANATNLSTVTKVGVMIWGKL